MFFPATKSRFFLALFNIILFFAKKCPCQLAPAASARQQRLTAVTVSMEPKRPMTRCSGEEQQISCQLIDYEGELPKQMRKQQENSGYGGYLEFLLFKKDKNRQHVVTDIHINYPKDILTPKSMMLTNLTIFDKGEYNCTVIWHGISGDLHWFSEPLQLNVYDCIDLETGIMQAKQGDSVTMQCIDVEAPIKWFKGIIRKLRQDLKHRISKFSSKKVVKAGFCSLHRDPALTKTWIDDVSNADGIYE